MTLIRTPVILKHISDQHIVNSPTCGKVHEILRIGEYDPLGIAIAINIKPTQGHFHLTFDEIYFVLDGYVILEIYDPRTEEKAVYDIKENELCVITKGVHHKIIDASENNRLCVISAPPFHRDDELPSRKIP